MLGKGVTLEIYQEWSWPETNATDGKCASRRHESPRNPMMGLPDLPLATEGCRTVVAWDHREKSGYRVPDVASVPGPFAPLT